jgi:hypothetical protein
MSPRAWERAFEVAAVAEGELASAAKMTLGTKEWNVAELATQARKHGVVETGLVADLEGAVKDTVSYKGDGIGSVFKRNLNPFSTRGIFGGEQVSKIVANRGVARAQATMGGLVGMQGRVGHAGTATTENMQRMRVFLGRLEMGDSVEEAAKAVTKFLFDYTGSQLSDIEKAVRRVMPFYQWVRFSTEQTITQMLAQPQKYANLARLYDMVQNAAGDVDGQHVTASDPMEVPNALVERGAIYAPGFEQSADKKWMLALERPGAGLNLLDPLFKRDMLTFLGEKMAPQLSPYARMPVEMATGEYAFGGGKISPGFNPNDENNSALENATRMNSEDMAGYFLPTLGGAMGSLATTAFGVKRNPKIEGSVEDERLRQQLLSTILGVRGTAFNPAVRATQNAYEDKELFESRAARKLRAARGEVAEPSPVARLIAKILGGGS